MAFKSMFQLDDEFRARATEDAYDRWRELLDDPDEPDLIDFDDEFDLHRLALPIPLLRGPAGIDDEIPF